MATKPLWEKDLPLDQVIHRFTVGNDPTLDLGLVPYDLLGTAAHVRMLNSIGLLSNEEMAQVITALQGIAAKHRTGEFVIDPVQEDCHTAIEQALSDSLGDTGKKIHLGRSRNDQVILALRLYMRDAVFELGTAVVSLAQNFISFAQLHESVTMPGYTHLRQAMPSSIGIWAISFAEALIEELQALPAVYERLDRCPLGSAAGFGVPLQIDRQYVADLLGFSQVQRSVADVQNSRGRHELALASWISSVGNVLEKYYWDVALFSTREFGFLALPDQFTTGSSIMPQKRNPDVIELLRGRCAQLRTLRTGIENIHVGLPSNYHREYQLLKEPLFQSVGMSLELLGISGKVVSSLKVNNSACEKACSAELLATQEAYRRVKSGATAFRDAYREVGREVVSGTFVAPKQIASKQHIGGAGYLALETASAEISQQAVWLKSTHDALKEKCSEVL